MAQSLKHADARGARSWVVSKKQGASYTGGPIAMGHDGSYVLCMCNERVARLDLGTGLVNGTFPGDDTSVRSRAVCHSSPAALRAAAAGAACAHPAGPAHSPLLPLSLRLHRSMRLSPSPPLRRRQ